jgi:hypothetical protein
MMKWVNELIRAFSKKEVQVVEKKEKKRKDAHHPCP